MQWQVDLSGLERYDAVTALKSYLLTCMILPAPHPMNSRLLLRVSRWNLNFVIRKDLQKVASFTFEQSY